jgi:hypothetical protein
VGQTALLFREQTKNYPCSFIGKSRRGFRGKRDGIVGAKEIQDHSDKIASTRNSRSSLIPGSNSVNMKWPWRGEEGVSFRIFLRGGTEEERYNANIKWDHMNPLKYANQRNIEVHKRTKRFKCIDTWTGSTTPIHELFKCTYPRTCSNLSTHEPVQVH